MIPRGLLRFGAGVGPSPAWDDTRLIESCLSGEADAWEALVEKYKRLVYAIPFRYGADDDGAAEVFQAVFIDLNADMPKLRRTGSLRSWLITVAKRHSLRWKNSRWRSNESIDNAEGQPAAIVEPEWEAKLELSQVVGEALERLDGRCRKLVERLFFEDPPKPYAELAAELGLATGSIGFNRGRCLEKLRREMEELGW